jgi:flagellar motility protein MotE (MotC chaperone)
VPAPPAATVAAKDTTHGAPKPVVRSRIASAAVGAKGDGSSQRRLAKVFGNMPAKEAARVLEQMDDKDVQTILGLLADRQAAAILASFAPPRAAAIGKMSMRTVSEGGR